MLAVGEHVLGHVDDQMLRMTTGFSGGSAAPIAICVGP